MKKPSLDELKIYTKFFDEYSQNYTNRKKYIDQKFLELKPLIKRVAEYLQVVNPFSGNIYRGITLKAAPALQTTFVDGVYPFLSFSEDLRSAFEYALNPRRGTYYVVLEYSPDPDEILFCSSHWSDTINDLYQELLGEVYKYRPFDVLEPEVVIENKRQKFRVYEHGEIEITKISA